MFWSSLTSTDADSDVVDAVANQRKLKINK